MTRTTTTRRNIAPQADTPLWGEQTALAIANFPISGLRLPAAFIRALAYIKAAAAEANTQLRQLDADTGAAIRDAALAIAQGAHAGQFPVDVFQTGSATSTNMNINEVIATLASHALGRSVHPNDAVNCGQSSNDVIPTALHLAAALELEHHLKPALRGLQKAIDRRGRALDAVVKTGRTHLMDALPLTFGQQFSGYSRQIAAGLERLDAVMPRLRQLAQGGTAVGTGLNAHPRFAALFARRLSALTGVRFVPAQNTFEALSTLDTVAELSGQLKVIACSLMKIANDLRWMNSGPLAGLAEIHLPDLQPGSSIMPGKVNPVIPEAVCMVAAQVIGHDAAITVAAQSGNFQLNVMLPLAAHNLLQSVQLLGNAARLLGEKAIAGFTVNHAGIARNLASNPILVTALNPHIGYAKGAAIAKKAYASGEPIYDVALRDSGLDAATLKRLLDPLLLTGAARSKRH
jgi:fumarate hydratase, class II